MDNPLTIIVSLAVAVGIVTLVGHGIWVLLAALFRPLPPAGKTSAAITNCRHCGARLIEGRCSVCNWPAPLIARDRTPLALAAARDQIDRFLRLGLIDRSVHQRLVEALDTERQQWLAAPLLSEVVAEERAEVAEPIESPPPLDEYAIAPLESQHAPPARSPEQRVRQYLASQAEAAASSAQATAPADQPAPRPPRARLANLLAAFMEEKNIRWGELIGGLLIVCCSIALVISFWAKIAERPLLKFFVFNGVTAALFGLGLYSAHRWKLRTTSQAVLTISILLVPLNFLAIAAFSAENPSNLLLTIAGEAISVLLFAVLCYWGGRMVAPEAPWLLVIGVVWPSVVQLLIRRWIDPAADMARLLGFGGLPLLGYAAVNGLALWRKRRVTQDEDSTSTLETLALLGVSTFAALLPLGLLLFKTGRAEAAIHQIALLVSGFGMPSLAVGLFLWRRLSEKRLAGLRTAALSVAVAGAAALVAGVALAWPIPMAMLPTALFAAATFMAIAIALQLPEAHWPGVACLALAYLTGWHLAAGRFDWQEQPAARAMQVLISGASGQALAGLAVGLFAAAAVAGRLRGRSADARALAIGAAGVAAVALGLVGWFGFGVRGDPLYATWIFGLFGLAACAAAARLQRPVVLWIGAALTLGASIQGVVYLATVHWPLAMPWATSLALDATLMVVAAIAFRRWGELAGGRPVVEGFSQVAFLVSVALVLLVAAACGGVFETASAGPLAIHWLWLGAMWLGLAMFDGWAWLFAGFQLAVTAAVWFGVGRWLETQAWFLAAEHRWLDPWVLQVEGIAIALLSLFWILLRWAFTSRLAAQRAAPDDKSIPLGSRGKFVALVSSERLAADRVVLRAVLVLLVALGLYAVWPGIAQELLPRGRSAVVNSSGAAAPKAYELFGIPHEHAAGWGSWLLMASIAAALAAEIIARRSAANVSALILTLSIACPLAGSSWGPQIAAASATRWFAAGFLILGSTLLYAFSLGERWRSSLARSVEDRAQLLLLLLGGVPALAIAWYAVAMAAEQTPVAGLDSSSLFGRMGAAVSYGGPILLTALALIAYGIRRRTNSLILCGGIVGNFAATAAYLLALAAPGLHLDAAHWIGLAQLNAIVAAGYALAWIAIEAWQSRRAIAAQPRANWPLVVEVGIAAACNAAVLVPAWLSLVARPTQSQALLETAGAWGWTAGLLTAAAMFAASRVAGLLRGVWLWAVWLTAATTLAAWTACRWDTGDWLGYHVLLIAHLLAAALIAFVGWLGEGRFADRNWTTNLGLVASAVAVVLGLRTLDGDPAAPWWALGALASQALLVAWLASWSLRRGLLYISALLINVAASIWWVHHVRTTAGGSVELQKLIEINIVAVALPAVAWLLLELRRFRPRLGEWRAAPERSDPFVPLHRIASRLSLGGLALGVGGRLALAAVQAHGLSPVALPEWLALGAVAVAVIACLWDTARDRVAALYFLGLVAAGVLLDRLDLEPKWLWWGGDLALAAYALATSCLWWQREGLRTVADRLQIPRAREPISELQWLVPLNCAIVTIVVALSFGFVLTFDDYALRLAAAKAVLFQMVTVGLLAQGERRWQLQHFSLTLGAIGAVALGWAGLDPAVNDLLLNRTVVAAAALAATVVVYGLGLAKLLPAESDWLRAAKRLAPVLVAIDACAVLLVLGVEASEVLRAGHVTMTPAAIGTVGVVLLGLCAACLAAAVLPGRDPLGLSEPGRRDYVYAAEVLLALLFAHIRLTKPEWFHGFLEQYWPLVVQGIAFVGVGVGEWFQRRSLTVIGEPLETTGAFLPLLPVIGFWILPTAVDYSLLLLAVGLLYAALSVARRSFGFGLIALAAANGSLWYFLGRQEGYRFLDHPQLWLIPPAMCVLIAAHLNRRQLSAAQTTAIRYGASIVLYVSSTADIFLQGVARAPWLPLVLGGISLLGVFAGILLRVRAFLILGTSFLLVALMTIIWYAAVDLQQTWLWSASGIVTGVLILVVFAIFEKQRQAVLGLLEKLKQWQP